MYLGIGIMQQSTAKALSFLKITKINHVSIWKWIQKYRPWKHLKKKKIKEYIIDETAIKAGYSDLGLCKVKQKALAIPIAYILCYVKLEREQN
jgi:hypothetical protein